MDDREQRRELARQTASAQNWGVILNVLGLAGLALGFLAGVYIGNALGGAAPFFLGLFIGPAIGGFLARRIGMALWAR